MGQATSGLRLRAALLVILAAAAASPAARPAYNRVQVPIRWCIVAGSPAIQNPGCACQPNYPFVTMARMGRASTAYQNCRILLRGAGQATSSGFVFPNVRVIADPCDPAVNPSCPGATGDIFVDISTMNVNEYFQAVGACRAAWNQTGISAPGLIGVNINRFVIATGALAPVWGLGNVPIFNNASSQATSGQFAVMDDDYVLDYTNIPGRGNMVANPDTNLCMGNSIHPATPPCAPQLGNDGLDVLTSHEAGHALSLFHTPATAMAASGAAAFPWMTAGGPGMTDTVCPAQPLPTPTSQCGQLRLQSICHQNGVTVDPPPVVDEQPLSIGDAAPGWIDLELVGLVHDSNTSTAEFFWRAIEPFPAAAAGLRYEFALDTDQNPASGGDPALVGVAAPLAGAELAGAVTVDISGGEIDLVNVLFWWDGVNWVPQFLTQPSAGAGQLFADDSSGGGVLAPTHSVVSLSFPAGLLGASDVFTFRARATDPGSLGEDLPAEGELYLIAPSLSVCEVAPGAVLPGAMVSVGATGLNHGQPTRVWFDLLGMPSEVATGMTDPLGNTASSFVVPPSAAPGPHTVRVLVEEADHEISSVCTVEVLAPQGPPGESSAAGQMLVTGHDEASGEVDVTYEPACGASDHIAYSGSLAQVAALDYDDAVCSLGNSGSATLTLPPGDRFFLIAGENGVTEGSYGLQTGGERPEADLASECNRPQDLAASCVP